MLKKIDQAKIFLEKHSSLFICPLCHEECRETTRGFACKNGHQYDLSKKGTLYFLDHQIQTEYDKKMFQARRNMIASGMYQPVLAEISKYLVETETLLDVGCGEGSFLAGLKSDAKQTFVGFDIAKEGIYLATQQPVTAFWCVADLTNLPFANKSFSTVLNIFSPSNYQEFRRVTKPGGQLIKVIPNTNYLKELRQAFYPDDVRKQSYSNAQVVKKFMREFPKGERQKISYSFAIPEARREDILEMSPLEWGVSPVQKEKIKKKSLEKITIDIELLIGKNF